MSTSQTSSFGSIIGVLPLFVYGIFYHMNWRLDLPVPADPAIEAKFNSVSKAESTAEADAKNRNRRKLVAITVMGEIRMSEPHPKSIQWDSIRTDDEPNIVCIQYRSHHGTFLKEVRTNRQAYSVNYSSMTTMPIEWDKSCHSMMTDVKPDAELAYSLMHFPKKHR